MSKVESPQKCNKEDIINFNGEKFECLKEIELPQILVKSCLWNLCAEGYLKRLLS